MIHAGTHTTNTKKPRQHPRPRIQNKISSQHPRDRSARPHRRRRRVQIHRHLRAHRDQSCEQVKHQILEMPQVILNIVPKDVEIPHVPDNVHPRPMQKHRGEEGKHDRRQRVPGRACKKRRQMRRHHAKLPNQQLQAPRIQRRLKEKNHQVQPNQKLFTQGVLYRGWSSRMGSIRNLLT